MKKKVGNKNKKKRELMMRELDNGDATSNNLFCKCSLRGKRGWSRGV